VAVAVFPLAGAFSSFFGSDLMTGSSVALALFFKCHFWTTLWYSSFNLDVLSRLFLTSSFSIFFI